MCMHGAVLRGTGGRRPAKMEDLALAQQRAAHGFVWGNGDDVRRKVP